MKVLGFFWLQDLLRKWQRFLCNSISGVTGTLGDSKLNSLSLPTLPQYNPPRGIFVTFTSQCEVTLSKRPSTRTACLPDKLPTSKECPPLYRCSHRSPARWYWSILICSFIRYTVCCCAGPSGHFCKRIQPVCRTFICSSSIKLSLLLV